MKIVIANIICPVSCFCCCSLNATNNEYPKSADVTYTTPSLILAKGAYVPESGYDTLDFSMPSYRVDADVAEPIRINDVLGGSTSSGNDDRSSTAVKKASSSSPNRAEKGALAMAQAKAKKEAAKAEALAKQQALKEKTFDK